MNSDILPFVFFALGIKDFTAETDQPEARIKLSFKRRGKPVELDMSLREVIDIVHNGDSVGAHKADTVDREYIDIRELTG